MFLSIYPLTPQSSRLCQDRYCLAWVTCHAVHHPSRTFLHALARRTSGWARGGTWINHTVERKVHDYLGQGNYHQAH
jgi:hypothetical protein